MIVIKECPFCGSEVELTKEPLWNGYHGYRDCYKYDIRCKKCGCHRNLGNNDTIYNTDDVARKNALDKWNERSSKRKEKRMTKKLDEFINYMFPPVEDKPGYVWINKRNKEIAKVDLIKERIESAYEQYCILQEKLNPNNTKEVRMPLCKELQADMVIIDEFFMQSESEDKG